MEINFKEYQEYGNKALQEFSSHISTRLKSLSNRLAAWDGNKLMFEKANGIYPDAMLKYAQVQRIQNWLLENQKKKTLTHEIIMEVCSFLGECVIAFTPGKWNIDEAEFDADGDENESRYLPSIEKWDMYDDDALSYTPLFSIEHFLRTKSKKENLEMSLRYRIEHGDGWEDFIGEMGEHRMTMTREEFDRFESEMDHELFDDSDPIFDELAVVTVPNNKLVSPKTLQYKLTKFGIKGDYSIHQETLRLETVYGDNFKFSIDKNEKDTIIDIEAESLDIAEAIIDLQETFNSVFPNSIFSHKYE